MSEDKKKIPTRKQLLEAELKAIKKIEDLERRIKERSKFIKEMEEQDVDADISKKLLAADVKELHMLAKGEQKARGN